MEEFIHSYLSQFDGMWALAIAIPAIFIAKVALDHIRGIRAAERIVSSQFDRATEAHVNYMVELANQSGRKALFISELQNIRIMYGHEGVKVGHLIWIDMKISGQIDPDASAPPFTAGPN